MNLKKIFSLSLSLLFLLIIVPSVSYADFTIINPDQCSGRLCLPANAKYCTLCDGLNVVKSGLDNLSIIGIAVAVLVVTYGGVLIMLGGAMPAKIQEGKKAITGAIFGVVIMLSAWLIVNQVIFLFVTHSVTGKPWNQIDCPVEQSLSCTTGKSTDITSGAGSGGSGGTSTNPSANASCSCDSGGCSCSGCTNGPGVAYVVGCVQSSGIQLGNIITYQGKHSSCNSNHFGMNCSLKGTSHAIDFGLAFSNNKTQDAQTIIGTAANCAQNNKTSPTKIACYCETNGPPVTRLSSCDNLPDNTHIHCDVDVPCNNSN